MPKRIAKYILILPVLLLIISPVYGITAKFSFASHSNCAPTVVEFTNSSTHGTGITYTWNFGLGSTVTGTDFATKEQLYTSPGVYTVSLKVSDGKNTDSTSLILTVLQGPHADFSADREDGCAPLTVIFTSTSTAGSSEIVNYSWDFRNGDTGEGTSVSYTYATPGSYDIRLKVTDKNGCSSAAEYDNLVTVADKPSVNFTASDTFACKPPLNVTFFNLSTGASDLTCQWDFGNGKTAGVFSTSSAYTSTGSYDVKLTATDQYGCTNSLVKKSFIRIGNSPGVITVYDANHDIVENPILCSGTYTFAFSRDNLPNYTWKITDGDKKTTVTGQDSLEYLVKDYGTLSITLVYGKNSFCTDSITNTYTKGYIHSAFTLSDSILCSVPQTVSLLNTSKNASNFTWYVSGRSFSTDANASYTLSQADLPASTYKQLYSHDVNVIQVPFKLVVGNGGGCVDSVTRIVKIALPVARFIPDKLSGCIPLKVTFSDSSKSAFKIDQFKYRIGNDSLFSLNGSPVQYTFTKPADYNVSEIIRSGMCRDTSVIVRIEAGSKLKLDFTVSPAEVCNGGQVHIVGNSNTNALVDSWNLFSPGLFNIGFTHKPDTAFNIFTDTTGYKKIRLQAVYNGCTSDTTKSLLLKIKGPAGNFNYSFACESPLVYHFKLKISPAFSLTWTIDTAVVRNTDSLTYKFRTSGDYPVKLEVTDLVSGCTLTRSEVIGVRQVKAAFSVNDSIFCVGDTVKLNASGSHDYIHTCYKEGFLWKFGDDSPGRRTFSDTYNYTYSSRGTDTILLVVLADNGCRDSISKTVRIYKPDAKFITDKKSGCIPGMRIQFTNTSTDKSIITWVWNFGDHATDSSLALSISHLYTGKQQQTFYPTLTVYDAYQCSGSYSIPLTLESVNSNFQADDNAICIGESVKFEPVDSAVNNLLWTFGDGSSSAVSNIHTYNKPGNFTVSLAASKDGCRDTVTKQNYISVEQANANFTMSDSTLDCYPDTIHFVHNNLIGSPAVDRQWTFNNHLFSDHSSDAIQYLFTRAGNYIARLTVKTLNGCTASAEKKISITGPTASIRFSPQKICYHDTVTFQIDSLHDVNSWKWYFGDGNTSTGNPVSHVYLSRGSIVPSILLMNGNCNALNMLDTLRVSTISADFTSKDSSLNVCYGNKLELTNLSNDSKSWYWEVDNVFASADFNPGDISLADLGDHYVTLIAMDAGHCSDTLVKKFTVVSNPVFSIEGDSTLCYGKDSTKLTVVSETGWKISWTPSHDFSNPAAFITWVSPTATTTYTAVVTNASGCKEKQEKKIVMNQPFDLQRIPVGDTTIYLGEKIGLKVITGESNVQYTWWPDDAISCQHCSNPVVWPGHNTTYKVEVKNGCFQFLLSFNIEVIADYYLEAPSAFTPNGDGNNDKFLFEGKNIRSFDLKIFNRWGEMVYASVDVSEGWDGTVNGHAQNIDTYTYRVKAETIHGYKFEKTGEFLLLK